MNIELIAAVSFNSVIGRKNDLPWRLPSDLKHFKEYTMGKAILMGRRTFESLPGLLPGRVTIVISSDYDCVQKKVNEFKDKYPGKDIPEVMHAPSLTHFFSCDLEDIFEDIVVVGGGTIYKQMYPFVDKMMLTIVEADITDGDTYFPIRINWDEWEEIKTESVPSQKQVGDEYPFSIKSCRRIGNDNNIFDISSGKRLSKLEVIRKKLSL